MAPVSINNVRKSYGALEVLHGVSIDIADGEFVVLVGPSGCGKSTLLRMLAGLEDISAGEISIGDLTSSTSLQPKERDIAWSSRAMRSTRHDGRAEHGLLAEACPRAQGGDPQPGRQGCGHAQPRRLISTATASAVRWASASASPWGAPWCAIRKSSSSTSRCPTSTRSCGCRCGRRSSRTTIGSYATVYVTHDQIEAMTMADKIVVMHGGTRSRWDSPRTLRLPSKPFRLQASRLPCDERHWRQGERRRLHRDDGTALPLPFPVRTFEGGEIEARHPSRNLLL